MSLDLILPFLRPLAPLLQDPEISEIMVTPPGRVFVERAGELVSLPDIALDERHTQVAVRSIARRSVASWNPISDWLRQVDALRDAA